MPRRGGQAHVATIKTKGKGGTVYTSYLLRRSYREGGKVRHENLGNLSHLPIEMIDAIRKMLAGRVLVDLDEQLRDRVLAAARARRRGARACCASWIWSGCSARERCRERDLVVAMICQLVIAPVLEAVDDPPLCSRPRSATSSSLGEVTEAELLAAMDWLRRAPRSGSRRRSPAGTCRRRTGSCSTTCPPAMWRGAAARWRRWGTAATASRASCRSTGGWCARPRDGRSRCRCTRATPPTRAPFPDVIDTVQRAVRDRAGDPGRRPGDDHRRARRHAQRARRRVRLRAEERADPQADRTQAICSCRCSTRPTSPRSPRRVPRRAAGGVPQPAPRRRARPQTRGPAARDRARTRQGQAAWSTGPRGTPARTPTPARSASAPAA